MIKFLFNFALRLLAAFLLARLLLNFLGGGSPALLLGLALGLTGLTYLIAWLERYYQRTWHSKVAEWGWRLARLLIGFNQVHPPRPPSKSTKNH